MLCTKCGKNEATFYFKQNINGKVTETALCADCASKLHVGQKLLDDALNFNPFAGLFGISGEQKRRGSAKRCPLCGFAFDDIVSSGKVGCAKCYETFGEELAPTIRQLHGAASHNGRGPKGFSEKMERKQKLASLKAELQKSIEEQNFEKAAQLRDQIKAIEADNGANA